MRERPAQALGDVSERRGGLHVCERAARVLDCVGDVPEEAGSGFAVAHSVVEGEGQLGDLADGQLPPGDHPGPVDDTAHAEHRNLGVVDDRGRAVHTKHAVVVQREGAGASSVGGRLSVTGDGGESPDLCVQFAGTQLVRVPDGRDNESAVGLGSEAEVDAVEANDFLRAIRSSLKARVQGRVLF